MTSVLTTKFTIDPKTGNWIEVPVILTRRGNGWVETYPSPSAGADRKEAA